MKDKTKELADSVGAVYPVLFMGRSDGVLFTETELETFVTLVAAAEREAGVVAEREECAKLADKQLRNVAALLSSPPKSSAAWEIAIAIRARGTK